MISISRSLPTASVYVVDPSPKYLPSTSFDSSTSNVSGLIRRTLDWPFNPVVSKIVPSRPIESPCLQGTTDDVMNRMCMEAEKGLD